MIALRKSFIRIMSSIKFLSILVLFFSSLVSAEDSPDKKYWKLYLEKANPILKSFQDLEGSKAEIVTALFEHKQKILEVDKLSKKLNNKKLSEADRSIIEKQLDDIGASIDVAWSKFEEKFQFVALELSDAVDLRREKIKNKILSKKDIEGEFDALVSRKTFKHNHNLLQLVDSKCVKDQKFNSECLKKWISNCAETFSTVDNRLAYEAIDDQLVLKLNPSDSPSELFKRTWEDETVPNWFKDGISTGTYACLFVASQGYKFQKQSVYFENFEEPAWLTALRERENYTLIKIANICPPEPIAIQNRGKELLANPRVAKDVKKVSLPSYLKGVAFCEMFVKETCKNVHRISPEDFAYNYATKGCEVRNVTKQDVADDVADFKEGSSTDADIKKHEQIAEVIEACSIVEKKAYEWKYVPAIVSNDCKKRRK